MKQQKNNQQSPPETFVVVRALTYGDPERRVEAGREVGDLPAESTEWLLEQGHIRRKEGQA